MNVFTLRTAIYLFICYSFSVIVIADDACCEYLFFLDERILLNEVKDEISGGVGESKTCTIDKWMMNGQSVLTPLSKLEDLLKGNDFVNGSNDGEEVVDVLEGKSMP